MVKLFVSIIKERDQNLYWMLYFASPCGTKPGPPLIGHRKSRDRKNEQHGDEHS
jgi:hypothetical protein